MTRSSDGCGTFKEVYRAFKQECNRYAKQKLIPVSNKAKMFNMTYSEKGMEQLTSESFRNLLTEFDTFICGADGLLWLRDGVILEASSLINLLLENEKEVIILTNDTTKTRANHEQKLKEHRFSSKLTREQIVTPGLVAAEYIKNTPNFKQKVVYLIAAEGVQDDLANAGIKYFGEGPDLLSHSGTEAVVFNTDLSVNVEDVGAVIVGFDKNFNYKKMMKAANYLKNPNCLFLATNDDATFSCQRKDIVVPDAGKTITVRSTGQIEMLPNYYATSITALLPVIK
ncbi:HAD hydrolase, family IIA [Dictyocaulus viviparus]|uniref:HAD hydrolase, family IIA n=1 Tax=Dictyocaulus viviparus TaxID=29172 RepID=A0A0D8Y3R5_DICVI|nr:HAD hydrolase, family IIA [Dictyocaulus viviparus]